MHKQSIASEDFGIDFDNDRWWRAFPAIYDGGSIGIGSPPIKIETASNRIIFRSIKKKRTATVAAKQNCIRLNRLGWG